MPVEKSVGFARERAPRRTQETPRPAELDGDRTYLSFHVEQTGADLRLSYVRRCLGTCRMSRAEPAGSRWLDGIAKKTGRTARAMLTGTVYTTADAQQPHVQRTQNAGHPVSGPDSLVPIAQVSGIRSELTPLASAIRRVKAAIRNAERIAIYPTATDAPSLGDRSMQSAASAERRL